MRQMIIFLIILLNTLTRCFADYNPVFPSFDDSIRRYGASHIAYTKRFEMTEPDHLSDYLWKIKFKELAEKLYAKNHTPDLKPPYKERVPKIIHQIWLGSAVPEMYKQWMNTWVGWHGWEYKLWTDADVPKLNLINKDLFDAAKNYGEKSDIMRYEILFREGGIYVDTDFECLRPEFFDYASTHYDFFVGMEPIDHGVVACNALIGSKPKHPILEKMINSMRSHHERNNFNHINQTISKTGPMYFSTYILEYGMNPDTIDIIFPPTFFYPFTIQELYMTKKGVLKLVRPETVALHWWETSWLKPPSQNKDK